MCDFKKYDKKSYFIILLSLVLYIMIIYFYISDLFYRQKTYAILLLLYLNTMLLFVGLVWKKIVFCEDALYLYKGILNFKNAEIIPYRDVASVLAIEKNGEELIFILIKKKNHLDLIITLPKKVRFII